MPDFGRYAPGGGDPSLNEINRIDRFVDALATKQTAYSTDRSEAELAFLLADWRDGVRDAPLAAVVTPAEAAAALRASAASRKRSRNGLALVGSVAAAVLCLGGFGTAVYSAGPGDSLYGLRSSLFGTQQATRSDQVSLASAQLAQVQQLVDQGQWQEAQDKLVALSPTVQNIDNAPAEQQQQLTEQFNALTYKVVQQDPAATLPPPGAPQPELPALSPLTLLPVPVVEQTTTTSSESTTSSSPTDPTGGPVGQEPDPATTTAPSTPTTSPPTTPTSQTESPTTTAPPSTTTTPPSSSTSSPTVTTPTTTTTTVEREAPQSPQSPAAAPPPSAQAPALAPAPRVAPSPVSVPAVQVPEEPAPTQQAKPSAQEPPPAAPPTKQHESETVVTTTAPRSAGSGG